MAGLSLRAGAFGNQGRAGMMPTAATVGPGSMTVSDKAFGVMSQQSPGVGPRTAGLGTVALGLLGASVLLYLWWSLPR